MSATIDGDARRILRAYEPTIRFHLTAWLKSHLEATGADRPTIEDINVGVYQVLEALQEPITIDTGELDPADLAASLNREDDWVRAEDFFRDRRSLSQGCSR